MKKAKLFPMFFLFIFSLMGCNANNNDDVAMNNRNNDGARNVRYQPDNVDTRRITNNQNDIDRNFDNNTRMEVADKAADRITDLDEVDSANVIVTNRNAYVAVELRDSAKGEVTNRLEKKIADKVRDSDRDIQNVYVSSNPDFVERMKDYGRRIKQGHPIEGFFDEFNETVRRVFPNPR
ncbi:YhcN/YlaJ family sporulation lipoprotein [Neobacillus niacini]|uniref:YhcN/YlaJ family sporulation lipoprotein n=1 Tax=Neobacillus niacini TaxID=86668 RepID=UPI000694792D|nr:YhcN/YlaJ family sporulation lipoprotein [Neobacillus niacini]